MGPISGPAWVTKKKKLAIPETRVKPNVFGLFTFGMFIINILKYFLISRVLPLFSEIYMAAFCQDDCSLPYSV